MKPQSCQGCPLLLSKFSDNEGLSRNGVLLIGESPLGESNYQLNRILKLGGLQREQFGLTTIVRCQTPNNWLEGAPWEHETVLHCEPLFQQTLKTMKPKVLVPMGNIALRSCLGQRGIEKFRGYVYDTVIGGTSYNVIPTYHPSFVLHGNQHLVPVVLEDIRRALKVAVEGYREDPYEYWEDPEDLEGWISLRKGQPLAVDIETTRSSGMEEDELDSLADTEILRISFSYKGGDAVSIPWRDRYIPWVQELLREGRLIFWNSDFDVPRLQAKGLVLSEDIWDAMWMYHFLFTDLPKRLGFAASLLTNLPEWKNYSSERPAFYNARDADATIQIYYAVKKKLEEEERWQAYLDHMRWPIPLFKNMHDKGILIDKELRQSFRADLVKEGEQIDERIGKEAPGDITPFKIRKKIPPEANLGLSLRDEGYWDVNEEGEWGIRQRFNPNSSKHLIAFMKKMGHKVPKNYKTDKETTGKDEIEKLTKKYPKIQLYKLCLERRKLNKIIDTYIDGQRIGEDGCVHPTFTHKTETGRLACEKPNLQNIVKRWNRAQEYRKQFIAHPGYMFGAFDYKGIEALLVGFYAKDPDYMRAAKLGVHAIFGSYLNDEVIDLKWDDSKIVGKVAEFKDKYKKTIYPIAKATIHGTAYGETPYKMHMTDPDLFPTIKRAEEMQQLYFKTIGRKVRQWQLLTLETAARKHYLETVFGFRRYFWDIWKWDWKKGQNVMSTQAKDALATLPQSTASDIMLRALQRLPWDVLQYLRLLIHDESFWEFPLEGFDENMMQVKKAMEAPFDELEGLGVETEGTFGENWGSMQTWK
jgi:uracil-DNA glycosylase family 4